MDALAYAPGPFVALCELGGEIVPYGSDKLAASERHYLTGYVDATRVLHEFACWCATNALDAAEARGEKVDPRSRKAVAVKLAWLNGKATDAELAAAWAAAWDATKDAAWDAACDAKGAAARAAAWAAARDAAWTAARVAAWDAAWYEQNAELERRLSELLGGHHD